VVGENLFATDTFLKCRFTFLSGEQIIVRGHHFNNTLMHCTVPEGMGDSNTAVLEVTTDGQGYTNNGFTFQYLDSCGHLSENITALGVVPPSDRGAVWWPWLFFLLLPLLCCLLCLCLWCGRRRRQPKEQQQRVYAMPAKETSPEEETFQIEGLETSPVAPNSPHKWKVQPAAYLGFGKAKMDVNWHGEAPESAPHALKRQRVPTNDPVEGIPLTPTAHVVGVGGGRVRQRRCCPWLCCVGAQDEPPQYPHNEGEAQHLAAVPRVVFHADSGNVGVNTTLESKSDVEG